jgi:phage terminase Nu1 subunit (DNA packaging protein)
MILNANEYAKIRKKSAAWVSDLIDQGLPVISAGDHGKAYQIDLGAAIDWEIEKAKRLSNEDAPTERLRRAQANRAEFENKVRSGEFMPIKTHGELLRKVVSEISGQMAGFPGRVAGKIAGVADPAVVRTRLVDECNAVRDAVADHLDSIAQELEDEPASAR